MIGITSKINRIFFLSFLFTLHISLLAYINSNFLTKIIPEQFVGIIYTVSAVTTLLVLSRGANVLRYFGNRKLVTVLLSVNMLALASIIVSRDPYILAGAFTIMLSTNNLTLFSLDVFIEHFGKNKNTNKTHGLYLSVTNIAWLISPLIASTLITHEGGYPVMYIVSFALVALTAVGVTLSVKHFRDSSYKKTPFLETYKYLEAHKHILAVTIINFILQFFFAVMVVYTPLYLIRHIGMSWEDLGIIFTIMLVPFVVSGLSVGHIVERYKIRRSSIIKLGFAIICISTASITFIHTRSIAIWATALFMTRVGASIIEAASEMYFFSHTEESEAYLLGVFRDMNQVALVIAPMIVTIILLYMPFRYLYLALALIMLSAFHYIPHLRHHHVGLNQNK